MYELLSVHTGREQRSFFLIGELADSFQERSKNRTAAMRALVRMNNKLLNQGIEVK